MIANATKKPKGGITLNLEKIYRSFRSTILEGIMGQAKEYHCMDKAKFRGINKVEIQILLGSYSDNFKENGKDDGW